MSDADPTRQPTSAVPFLSLVRGNPTDEELAAVLIVLSFARSGESANRPSGPGAHQFQRPINRIVAGTRRTRTIVASMRTAIAIPTPMLLIVIDSARAKAENTVTMIRAAPVITPAVFDRPSATDAVLSPVRR